MLPIDDTVQLYCDEVPQNLIIQSDSGRTTVTNARDLGTLLK
jgi:hypothetical protein